MARRTPRTDPRGRKTRLLEPDVHKTLVQQVQLGTPMELAAQFSGVHPRTLFRWMERGRAEDERLNAELPEGEPAPKPDKYEAPYLKLFNELVTARAQAAVRAVSNIQRVATGGIVTEETTRTFRDADGKKVTEVTLKKSLPDWRAAKFYLETSHRDKYGKDALQVEVTGTATGAGIEEDRDDAGQLSSRIAENIAVLMAASPAQITSGDVVDAEIVNE